MLDIPDEVWNKVVADGNAAWLDELPSIVDSLAQEWSLTIGATLRGGHAAQRASGGGRHVQAHRSGWPAR
jgi:streptomycin 6-kinase